MSEDYRARLIADRQKLGLSGAEMATRLMTPRVTYAQWESGVRRTPGVAVCAADLMVRYRTSKIEYVRALADGTHSRRDIAAATGLTSTTVTQYLVRLRREGVDARIRAEPSRRDNNSERDRAIVAAMKGGASCRAVAAQYDLSPASVWKIARAGGVRRYVALSDEVIQAMRELIGAGVSVAAAGRKLGLTAGRAKAAAKDAGVPSKHDRQQDRDRSIIEELRAGVTYVKIAARYGLSTGHIAHLAQQYGLTRRSPRPNRRPRGHGRSLRCNNS